MKMFTFILLALAMLLVPKAEATGTAAAHVAFATIRNVYSTTNVTTSAWVQLIASTTMPTSQIEIYDSSGQTLEIGIGSAGNEVVQFIIPPGGNGVVLEGIPKSTRIAIKALSASATTGELDITLYQ